MFGLFKSKKNTSKDKTLTDAQRKFLERKEKREKANKKKVK